MESPSSVKIKSEASLFTGGPHSNQTVAGGHLFFQSPKKHGCTSFMSSVVSCQYRCDGQEYSEICARSVK